MIIPTTTNTRAVTKRCHVRHERRSLIPSEPLSGTTATPELGIPHRCEPSPALDVTTSVLTS